MSLEEEDSRNITNGGMSNLPCYDEAGDVRLMSEEQRRNISNNLHIYGTGMDTDIASQQFRDLWMNLDNVPISQGEGLLSQIQSATTPGTNSTTFTVQLNNGEFLGNILTNDEQYRILSVEPTHDSDGTWTYNIERIPLSRGLETINYAYGGSLNTIVEPIYDYRNIKELTLEQILKTSKEFFTKWLIEEGVPDSFSNEERSKIYAKKAELELDPFEIEYKRNEYLKNKQNEGIL